MQNSTPRPSVSVIVPTYREALNLPELIARLDGVRREHGLTMEVLIMDDDSRDGTEEAVARMAQPWVRLVVRKENRGLSPAVLDGFCAAQYDVLLVMDADLSHPPEKIPELLDALTEGADFVIGSRYVGGGATDEDWGILRQINSRAATWLARPFTRACDPMSGFFALRRSTLESGAALNPVGYKIGLEVLVKCACRKVVEIPIHFSQRRLGESKLSFKEQLRYLQHLRRLAVFKYGDWAHFLQFALVGASGVIVNLAALTLLIWAYLPTRVAGAVAIFIAMVSNFALNRYITFSYARHAPVLPQLVGFMGACSLGALANYGVFLGALHVWPALVGFPQPAALLGILAGTVINYVMSRYFVFQTPKA